MNTLNRKFEINIGLLNNSKVKDVNDISELLRYFKNNDDIELLAHRLDTGEYTGNTEPTLVGIVQFKAQTLPYLITCIEDMCRHLTQECIPVSNEQFDLLIYKPSFEGERYKFNEQYFIRY